MTKAKGEYKRPYTPEEYLQMTQAAMEGLINSTTDAGGFDLDSALERSVRIITEQRINPDNSISTPFGGYELRKRMEEDGPRMRMKETQQRLFSSARRKIREVLEQLKRHGGTSTTEKAKRYWEAKAALQGLYDLPLRWRPEPGDERRSCWFENAAKSEIYKTARYQETIETYGKEGKELFNMVWDIMDERGAEEDTTIREVFGKAN